MPIYKDGHKCLENGDKGIWRDGISFVQVWRNGKCYYDWSPYVPGQVLVNDIRGTSAQLTLPRGVYDLELAGGGGAKADWAYSGYPWSAGGGSGGAWEGQFWIPEESVVRIEAGGAAGVSRLYINGTLMLTCNPGGNAGFNSPGGGGSVSVNSNLQRTQTRVSKTGNGGGTSFGGGAAGGASVSTRLWGGGINLQGGASQAGGARLKFIRNRKNA